MNAGERLRTTLRALLHRAGFRRLLRGVRRRLRGDSYVRWVKAHHLTPADVADIRRQVAALARQPLISVIVPVYNTPAPWLRACLDSVLAQFYPHWELCIADDASVQPHVRTLLAEYAARDPRVKVVYREQNGHVCVATNDALALATGEFVAFLDHDDVLAPHALYMVADVVNRHGDACLIYTDHDRWDRADRPGEPRFKPAWSPDLLRSANYINHLTVLRADLVRIAGGVRPGLEGAQDHDLLLRTTAQMASGQIHHIPHILYHWRRHPASISGNPTTEAHALAASHRAVTEAVRTVCPEVQVEDVAGAPFVHRIRYPVQDPAPLVSVIIPTRDRLDLLRSCLAGLQNPLRPQVGAVGPLLHYPDGRVQHGGIVLGDRVLARMAFHQERGDPPPSPYQLRRVRNVAALTGACLVMRRSVFIEVGGFDTRLTVAHNDTDLCLKLRAAGYWLVFTPFAELTHWHSASRGPDDTDEKRTRLQQEAGYLRAKWGAAVLVDPFLNPNTHWQDARLELNFPSQAQKPWCQGAE